MKVETVRIHIILVQANQQENTDPKLYLQEFCGSYQRMIVGTSRRELTCGHKLKGMIHCSLKVGHAYSRSSTDCKPIAEDIYRRIEPTLWADLGKLLVHALIQMENASESWNNANVLADFATAEWADLAREGESAYKPQEVNVAEDFRVQHNFTAREET